MHRIETPLLEQVTGQVDRMTFLISSAKQERDIEGLMMIASAAIKPGGGSGALKELLTCNVGQHVPGGKAQGEVVDPHKAWIGHKVQLSPFFSSLLVKEKKKKKRWVGLWFRLVPTPARQHEEMEGSSTWHSYGGWG
jgi:hypothetical protein